MTCSKLYSFRITFLSVRSSLGMASANNIAGKTFSIKTILKTSWHLPDQVMNFQGFPPCVSPICKEPFLSYTINTRGLPGMNEWPTRSIRLHFFADSANGLRAETTAASLPSPSSLITARGHGGSEGSHLTYGAHGAHVALVSGAELW